MPPHIDNLRVCGARSRDPKDLAVEQSLGAYKPPFVSRHAERVAVSRLVIGNISTPGFIFVDRLSILCYALH